LPIEAVTVVLYIKALKASPLSLTMPFLALTPVFLIFFSYVLLGEKVSLTGGAGILLIAVGSYLLNISRVKEGLCQPFRAITKEKGAVYMIIVALLYSITSSMGKMAIEHSSPLFFGSVYFIGLNLVYQPYGLTRGLTGQGASLREYLSSGRYRRQIVPGIFYAGMVLTHMAAMKLTKVAYMVSVKRSSLLISIMFGYLFFREENIRDRFLGALLMFAGFILVVSSR
jgi:drug/metabolite transporter (DMT)-like permease